MPFDYLKAATHLIYHEAWNWGNLDILDKYYAPGYIRHKPPFPDITGLDAAKQFIADSRRSYPDQNVTIHDVMVDGGKVVAQWTFEGTQVGESPTTHVAGTGKKIAFNGCNVAHWEHGQIVEEWEYSDWLVLLQQFGVIPIF